MAIQVRSKKGKVDKLDDDFQFIELTDAEGKVAMVFYKDAIGGVGQIHSGTKEAKRYKKLFNVDFCPVINVNL